MESSSGSMKFSALAMAMNTSSFTRRGTPCVAIQMQCGENCALQRSPGTGLKLEHAGGAMPPAYRLVPRTCLSIHSVTVLSSCSSTYL